MHGLTDRQIELLKAIIKEYVSTANPVGSQTIVEKYRINVSAATVRNEMADLMERGFLQMSHTSSGRMPSALAYRFFLEELLEEESMPVIQEVAIKQRLWPVRYEYEKLLKQATMALSDSTHEAAFALSDDGFLVYSGVVNLLDYTEFWELDSAKEALSVLDRPEVLQNILSKTSYGNEVTVLITDELSEISLYNSCFVYGRVNAKKNSYVGVFGPSRMNYERVIPTVRYVKNLVEELSSGW